jgi:hypothetical protein
MNRQEAATLLDTCLSAAIREDHYSNYLTGQQLTDSYSKIIDAMTEVREKDTRYNGWTNYETWRVNLELCDDTLQSWLQDVEAGFLTPWASLVDLADALEESAEDAVTGYGELKDDSLAVSYAMAFINSVNWHEIASHAVEDYPILVTSDEDDEEDGD